MTNLPNLTDLAATRLRNNAGRYQVAFLPDGTVRKANPDAVQRYFPVTVKDADGQDEVDFLPFEQCRFENAARARDNTLDALEELADCHNIIGVLLRERLAADEELTVSADMLIAQLGQQLREAAVTLGRIRVRLPAAYLSDQYEVQRDEVTT